MNKPFFYLISVFLISACGDDLDPLNTGGVSLGGTGLPTAGGGNIPPLTTDEETNDYIIWTKGVYTQVCENLTISSYFQNSETNEAILKDGHGTFLIDTNAKSNSNLTLVLTVKNNNLYPIYEYRYKCEPPVILKDQNQNIYEPIEDPQCSNTSDEYQILMPSDTWNYTLKYNIPKYTQVWNMKYDKEFSINQYSPINQRLKCSTFSLDFLVERM